MVRIVGREGFAVAGVGSPLEQSLLLAGCSEFVSEGKWLRTVGP